MKSNLIVFVGPDGSGKSTLSGDIKSFLETQGVTTKIVRLGIYNQRTALLKTVRKLAKEPKKIPIPTFVKSLFRFVDMWIRYLKIIPDRLKGTTIICDRYFYDLAFYSTDWFSRLLSKMCPRPTISFFVFVEVNELLKRKQEYSRQDLETHLSRMTELYEKYDLIKIRTHNRQKAFNQVKREIISKLKPI